MSTRTLERHRPDQHDTRPARPKAIRLAPVGIGTAPARAAEPNPLDLVSDERGARRRTTSIILADEYSLRRSVVACWLAADASLEVAAAASRDDETAALVVEIQPGVLILACDMPTHPFVALASRAPRLSGRTRVILLSDRHDPRSCRAARVCGAWAHIALEDRPEDLLQAVRGGASRADRCVPLSEAEPTSPRLSNREREVLVHLSLGMSAKQAAAALGLCPKTIDNHAQRLMRKLGLHSRAEVVRFAVREGYVAP